MQDIRASFQKLLVHMTGFGLFAAITVFLVPTAIAQDKSGDQAAGVLEEVIVSATRRETALQDTPVSITALTDDYLQDMGFHDLESFANSVPSLEYQNAGGAGSSRVTIRGISAAQGTSTVGIYFDDLPISSITVQSQQPDVFTYDLERVEVLRGPQGTLFGEGAMGGAIRFISNKPDPTAWDANALLSYGNINDGGNVSSFNGMVNIPVVEDKFALRLVGYYHDQEGWVDNTRINIQDINTTKRQGFRLTGRWLASDNVTVTAMISQHDIEMDDMPSVTDLELAAEINALFGFPFVLEPASRGFTNEDQQTLALTLDFNLGWGNLTSATSYFERDSFALDPVPSIESSFGLFGFDPWQSGEYTAKIFAQEFRLVSTTDGPLQWIAGAFYLNKERDIAVFLDSRPPLLGILATNFEEYEQWALFGELTYWFNDNLQATVGARYAAEKTNWTTFADFTNFFGFPFIQDDALSDDFSNILPKFLLGYNFSDDKLLYGSISKGYRHGGYNLLAVPGAPLSYDQDELWTYEFGWKTGWAENRVAFNGALFYNDWSDYQGFDESQPFIGFTTNVGDASTTGVELEFVTRPVDSLQLSFGGNYYFKADMETEFITAGGIVIKPGNRLPGVPEYTANASFVYTQAMTERWDWTLRGSYQVVGERFSDLENNPSLELPSYNLLNLRTGFENDRYAIILYVDNVADEHIKYSPNEYSAYGFLADYMTNRPRTIGIEFRASMR